MPKPTMRRRPVAEDRAMEDIVPYVPQPSDLGFYVPPVLEADFDNWLMTDVPGTNYTFEVVRNWYDRGREGYEPALIRASYFSIEWKSKIGNSDMGSNFLANTKVDIKKGDLVVREDGAVYLLDWKVQRGPNTQTSQAKDCNAMLEIWRTVEEVLDERGYVIVPAHDECIVPPIPCVWTSHSGRPDYVVAYNTPGIHADSLFDGWVQWNSTTRNIRIGDEFEWGHERFRIVNLHISEVEIGGGYGIIDLNAKRVAGGDLDG